MSAERVGMPCCGSRKRSVGRHGSDDYYDSFVNLMRSILFLPPLPRITESDDELNDAVKPRADTLLPDVKADSDWRPSIEWEPFSGAELDTLVRINIWADGRDGTPEFRKMPRDLLCQFVRGFAYRPDAARAAFAYLVESLAWRAKQAATDGQILRGINEKLLPRRSLFERFVQVGPIGIDGEGHPVIMERFCCFEPSEVLDHFSSEQFLAHCTYNKECQRAYSLRNAQRCGRRTYKVVTVIDLEGLSLAHTDTRFLEVAKKVNASHANAYPETAYKIIVVNAPGFFGVVFSLVSSFMHPLTVSKFDILGSDYEQKLAGPPYNIRMNSGGTALPPIDDPPSWSATASELAREWGGINAETLSRGGDWPREDAESLKRRGISL